MKIIRSIDFNKLFISFLISLSFNSITSATEIEADSQHSAMMQQGLRLENTGKNNDYWEAANLYCKAARQGNIEAQYRLGMLYAFGKGVTSNRAYAATLFSIAGRQGHHEAANMLETINFTSEILPPCIENQEPPEKKVN